VCLLRALSPLAILLAVLAVVGLLFMFWWQVLVACVLVTAVWLMVRRVDVRRRAAYRAGHRSGL
jgi:hypothetical protein